MVAATAVGNRILSRILVHGQSGSSVRWSRWLKGQHRSAVGPTQYAMFSNEVINCRDYGDDKGNSSSDGSCCSGDSDGDGSSNSSTPDEEEGGIAGDLISPAARETALASVAEEEERRQFSDHTGEIERYPYSAFIEEHLPLRIAEAEAILSDNPKIRRGGLHELRAGRPNFDALVCAAATAAGLGERRLVVTA